MINQFHAAGPWLMGSATATLPHINSSDDPMQGVVRVMHGRPEVYNGGMWTHLPQNTAYVDTTSLAKNVLEWALEKMQEERQCAELAKHHPAIADAVAAVRAAEEKLKIVLALTQETT
jgi:hypothetical protein